MSNINPITQAFAQLLADRISADCRADLSDWDLRDLIDSITNYKLSVGQVAMLGRMVRKIS